MANLSVSYEQMSTQARQLRTTRDQIQQMLNQARRQVENLVNSGFVTDKASVAFNDTYREYTTSATNTIDSLTTISQNLEEMVRVMQDTDRQLANQVGR